ncbi:uncharacterized protein LOC134543052 [Bacillus rossius redtenbacheri]|uniref:uncharacterized protein LOC134543052 n=1 Tax=Bacillus rossius redtenbacheri TaxID=93214 RepID=UPI002FDD8974
MDIYDVYRPIFLLCRALGLAPMRMRRAQSTGRWELRFSALAYTYSVGLVALTIPLMLAGVVDDFQSMHSKRKNIRIKNTTSAVVTFVDVLSMGLTAATVVLHSARQSGRLGRLLEKAAAVERYLGPGRLPRRLAQCITCGTLAHMLLLLAYDAWCWQALTGHDHFLPNYYPLYVQHILVAAFELHFVVVSWCLHSNFLHLNQQLAALQARVTRPLPHLPLVPPSFRQRVADCHNSAYKGRSDPRRLSDLHAELCEAVQLSNSAWGTPLLADVLRILLHLTITPYFFLVDLLYGSQDPRFLVLQALWTLTHACKLVLIVQPCSATHAEARRTGYLVSKLLNQKMEPNTKKQVAHMVHHTFSHNYKTTAQY